MGASLSSPRPYQDASRVSNLHPIVRAEQFIALPIRMMDKTLVSSRSIAWAIDRSVIAWANCPSCYDTSCVSPKATPSLSTLKVPT